MQYSPVFYGKKNVDAYIKYSESSHGSDGALFLDPYFKPVIENLDGKTILDVGCGAASWSIYAAKQGGMVYGIDIQPEMIQAAKEKVKTARVGEKVLVSVGDASALMFASNFFDRQISICVGCNLPEGIYERSFKEMARTLKTAGIAVIGAPNSLDIVFTDGSNAAGKVQLHIEKVLDALPNNPSPDQISESLAELTEIFSATFHIKDERLTLVTEEKKLQEGEKIWRKLPKPIVPNRYHSMNSYFRAFEDSNLKVIKVELPRFNNEEERVAYNANAAPGDKLGPEYVSHSPFAIYHVIKE